MSTSGQVVISREYTTIAGSNHVIVPVVDLRPGLYFIRLTTSAGVLSEKIMLNR
jgi:hypothetical protein